MRLNSLSDRLWDLIHSIESHEKMGEIEKGIVVGLKIAAILIDDYGNGDGDNL